MEAAQKFANDAVESQIADCRAKIDGEQRKLKRLQAQKKFFAALMKELAKPPKIWKPPKMSAKQQREMKKRMKELQAQGLIPPQMPVPTVTVSHESPVTSH